MIRSFATSLVIIGAIAASGAAPSAFAQGRQPSAIGPSAAGPSAAGLWEHAEDGKPSGWFRVVEKDGVYEGQIVKMFPKGGEDPASFRCTKCEDERKNALVLGITFIKGMQRKGLDYENGNVLDPRDGSIYSAKMQLSPDGKQLTMRGYLGISLFGQSQTWTRLPDNALGPDGGPSVAGTPAPTRKTQNRASTTGTAPPPQR